MTGDTIHKTWILRWTVSLEKTTLTTIRKSTKLVTINEVYFTN